MHPYRPYDVTARAHAIAAEHVTGRREEHAGPLARPAIRLLEPRPVNAETPAGKRKIPAHGRHTLALWRRELDLRAAAHNVAPPKLPPTGLLLALRS
jgi:hypothetical protein